MSAHPARPYHVRLINSADSGRYVGVFGVGSRGTDGERQGDGRQGKANAGPRRLPFAVLSGGQAHCRSRDSDATEQALQPSPSRKPGWLEAPVAEEWMGEGAHFHPGCQSRKEQTFPPLSLKKIVPCGGQVQGGLLSGERPGPRVAAVRGEQLPVPLPITVSRAACAPGEQLRLGKTGRLRLPRDVFAWPGWGLRHSGVSGRCRHMPRAWPVGQWASCRAYTLHLPAPLRGRSV